MKILPVVVGDGRPGALRASSATALAAALAGRRALIVASSDLSHYPAHADAARLDARTLTAAASLDPAAVDAAIARNEREGAPGEQTCACGAGAIMTMLAAARALGGTARGGARRAATAARRRSASPTAWWATARSR